jgi:maltose alpha-D-glucosyltransferase / alpha-amylase
MCPGFMAGRTQQHERLAPMVMGMMQEMVDNQGDAWDYISDELNRYFERVLAFSEFKKVPRVEVSLLIMASLKNRMKVIREVMGIAVFERISMLAQRTAEMHQALASRPHGSGF